MKIKKNGNVIVGRFKKILMKKLALLFTLIAIINGCNNSTNAVEKNDKGGVDSTRPRSPSDSINPPGGVISSSPISTNTAAFNMQNTLKKKDSIEKKRWEQ